MKQLALIAVLGLAVAAASADWNDNFDSYNLGTINGQGGWGGWANTPSAAGQVSDILSLSAPKSQLIDLGADSVHTYSGYNLGTWFYRTWLFIPTDFQSGGTAPDLGTYFIMLNRYTTGGADTRWSVQMAFDSTDQMIHADAGDSTEVTLPYVAGEWSFIDVHVNLTQNWTQVYYNGTLIDDPNVANHPQLGGGYSWTLGVFGTDTGGLLNIAAVDLYANGSSPVFYDDMALIPEPVSVLLLSVVVLLRRR
jgi:hypothetical protein